MSEAARVDTQMSAMSPWQRAGAATHLTVSSTFGLLIGVAVGIAHSWKTGGLVAWIAAATLFLIWTFGSLWSLDERRTAALAQREDPARAARDVVLLVLAAGSMVAVAVVIMPAGRSGWPIVLLGIGCIVVSWMTVHTVHMLRYARLYYTEPVGGLDFNQKHEPSYRDFAYVAFTIGMTFQVSDTLVQSAEIRTTVLRQALLSFLFSAIIIAVTINVIAGLGNS